MVLWIKAVSSEELRWAVIWKNFLQPNVTFPVGNGCTPSHFCLFHITNTLGPTYLLFIYFTASTDRSQLASVVCFFTSPLN